MNELMLVARREIVTQVRSRTFVIGLLVSAVLVAALAFAPKLFGGPDSYTLGVVNSQRLPVTAPQGATVEWRTYPDEAAARKALLDGDADAVVVNGSKVLSEGELDERLGVLLQVANREMKLDAQGVRVPPLQTEAVRADARYDAARGGMARTLTFLLFFTLVGQMMMVAMGVVEEKGSRIVEILLSSMKPWQLLGGKIAGLGVVGLINLVVIVCGGLGAATVSGLVVDFPPGMTGIVVGVFVWFLLGYVFYATLAAALASLVSRQEEVGSVMNPLMMALMGTYFVAFFAANEPNGTLAAVLSWVPPFSAMVMPVRMAATEIPLWEVAGSAVVMALAVAGALALGATVYRRAVLRTGARLKIRQVLSQR